MGAFPRCDYFDLDENDSDGDDNENEEGSQHSGRVRRRSALHELCLQCGEVENDEDDDDDEESQSTGDANEKNEEIYDLARQIIRASHRSINRSSWEHRHGYTRNNSLLTLYVGDQTPLHILCSSRKVDLGMISIIFGSVSPPPEREMATIELPTIIELLTSKSRLGCTPLHYLVENRSCSPETLEKILRFSESMVNLDTTTSSKQEACLRQNHKTLDEAFLTCDYDGETPLHWALESKVSPEHFRVLLKYGGTGALWCANMSDDFPFDQFARSCEEDLLVAGDEESTEEENFRHFVAMLSVVERALEDTTDSDGKGGYPHTAMPLHKLASSIHFPCPTYLFKLALRYHRTDLTTCDNSPRGLHPLHLALLAPRNQSWDQMLPMDGEPLQVARATNESHILALLEQHPECANLYSKEGRSSLHYAVKSHNSVEIIRTLLKIYPRALSSADPITGFYPFALAAEDENSTLEVVYELCRSCPSVLTS